MARSRVIVELPDRPSYDVRIGAGLWEQLPADLASRGVQPGRCLVLCDPASAFTALPVLKQVLGEGGFMPADITIPAVDGPRAWDCVAELHRALDALALPEGAAAIVCAGAQASQAACFALATWGGHLSPVLLPASLAAAYAVVGVDAVELDAGHAHPLGVILKPAFAAIDTAHLPEAPAQERALGFDELQAAAVFCDADFQTWLHDVAPAAGDFQTRLRDAALVAGGEPDAASVGENSGVAAAPAWEDYGTGAAAWEDDEVLVLAIAQTLASRADALGAEIRSR